MLARPDRIVQRAIRRRACEYHRGAVGLNQEARPVETRRMLSPVGLEQAVVLEAAAIHGGDLPAVLLQSRHLRDALHFRIAAAEADDDCGFIIGLKTLD